MGSIYPWQCDNLLDSMMTLHPLTDVAPSIGGNQSHGYDNSHSHTHAHMSPSMSEYGYTSISTPAFTTISDEDLHLLDCLPTFTEDMFFLATSFPNMDFACDDWGLPSGENLASSKSENGCLDNQNIDGGHHEHHETHDQHCQRDANQPIWDYACTDEPVNQSWYSGSSNEDLIAKGSIMTDAPFPDDEVIGTVNTQCMESRSKLKPRALKRRRSANNFPKPIESFGLSDDMEDDESDKLGFNGKASGSKNLVSERKRRMKLNEKLYRLRAIVPKISKMDKASIVADAISYVQDLQKRKKSLQDETIALQADEDASHEGLSSCAIKAVDKQCIKEDMQQHNITELDAWSMEPHTYHLRIHCRNGPGVLVQLTNALEALNFEIVNANFTTLGDHFVNTIIVKVDSDEVLRQEDVKEMIRQIIPMFGLHFNA